MNFGDKLRQLRRSKRLTQSDLADKIGVHLNTINRWEKLDNPIDDLTSLMNLSTALDTTVDYLRGDNTTEHNPVFTPEEYTALKPEVEQLSNGRVFYYEYNGRKIEIPACKDFIDVFLNAIKELHADDKTKTYSPVTVNNQAQAYDNAHAVAMA